MILTVARVQVLWPELIHIKWFGLFRFCQSVCIHYDLLDSVTTLTRSIVEMAEVLHFAEVTQMYEPCASRP